MSGTGGTGVGWTRLKRYPEDLSMTPMHPRARRSLIAVMAATLVIAATSGPVAGFARRPIRALPSPPLTGIVIAIDPGHNGGNATHASQISYPVWVGSKWNPCNRSGTATRSGYPEHRFNWLTSLAVKSRLEQLGATVYLTHPTDTGVGPCVTVRSSLGTRVGAALEVSIHADGADSSFHGFHINHPGVIPGWTDDIAADSLVLAKAIRDGMVAGGIPIANYYATNGLKTRTALGTLNVSDVPIVLIECGNMKNSGDAAQMTSSTGRARYADGIVAGIRRYLHK
jgi:N-acetylmuramoyl-L-alanine amidase